MLMTHFYRRLRTNLSDPGMRANVLALMGGKAIGLILLLSAMRIYMAPAVHAQAGAPAGPSPEINAINTAWTLIAAFLVFGMQVGFVMLEAGFARSRESINILVEGIVDTCICGITFWAWGFAFMFEPGNGFIGTTGFFLKGLAAVRAVDEMRMERLAFGSAQFAVEIGGEQLINLFVNRWHKNQVMVARAGLSRRRMTPRDRPRIPRRAPFESPRVCSIVA